MRSSPSNLIALIALVVTIMCATTAPIGVDGFKFMSKFKRGPRIDAAAEAKKEQMFGDKSKSNSSQRRLSWSSCAVYCWIAEHLETSG